MLWYCLSNDALFDSLYIVWGVVPFLQIPLFFEISFLDKVWEVNAFKYISQPLFFFVIILFIHPHGTRRLEAK